jgi:hypothetical protein
LKLRNWNLERERNGMNTLNLPRKWAELRPEDIGRLELELARETCPDHPLHGSQVRALYRRYPHDDVLFEVVGSDCAYYCVYLTWSAERDPNWPDITRFRTLEDFCVNYEMTIDVTEEDPRWSDERWRFYEPKAT